MPKIGRVKAITSRQPGSSLTQESDGKALFSPRQNTRTLLGFRHLDLFEALEVVVTVITFLIGDLGEASTELGGLKGREGHLGILAQRRVDS